MLLAHRSTATVLGLPVLGELKSYAVVGVPPDVMGIGPAFAIPVALQRAGGHSLTKYVGMHVCVHAYACICAFIYGYIYAVYIYILLCCQS